MSKTRIKLDTSWSGVLPRYQLIVSREVLVITSTELAKTIKKIQTNFKKSNIKEFSISVEEILWDDATGAARFNSIFKNKKKPESFFQLTVEYEQPYMAAPVYDISTSCGTVV